MAAADLTALTAECRTMVEAASVRSVIVAGADLNGILRGKRIPAQSFAADPTNPLPLSNLVFALDVRGDVVPRPRHFSGWWPSPEREGYADIRLVPDLSTFRTLPWTDGTALVLGDFEEADGTPVAAAPSMVLRRVLARAQGLGLSPRMAVELEFYILRGGQTGDLSAPEGYCAVSRTDDDELLDALTANLAMLGIETLTANREGGPGQYEITIRHNRLPDAAHEAILLKYAMKSVAQAHGATLTFMSKPNDNLFGSASHIHQSLVSEQTGENLFYGSDGPHGLSKTASAYIAGGLATMGDFTCMWASTPNAFKRLEPYAGGAPSWAFANRAAALRVTAPDAERCRIENRAPGGEANPYLVVAASLAAGLYGIENGLEAPEPSTEGFYEDPELERVPMTLPAAIERFEASPVAREYFGEEFVRFYAGTRRWEVERERHHVSDWEVERYSGGL